MAGLTFGGIGGQGELFNVSGPQFDLDPESITTKTYTYTIDNTSEIIYTAPKGKTLYITKILMLNRHGGAATFKIWIDAQQIGEWGLASGETKEVEFPNPMKVKSGESLRGSSTTTAAGVAMVTAIGWEQ